MEMMLLTARVMAGETANRGKIIVLGLLTLASLAISIVIGRSGFEPLSQADVANSATAITFVFIVPMVSLVFAIGGLGDSHHDGTLIYLWLRPTARFPIAAGSWLTAVGIALPFNLVSAAGSIALMKGDSSLIAASALAAATATLAYCGLFCIFGLLVRNSTAWGLAYVLVWEGIVANFGTIPARLSVRGYSESIMASGLDDPTDAVSNPLGLATAILVMLFFAVAGVATSTLLLNNLDIE